tara:strand:- start:88 stop:345 length:258 start_codon:yes stop_codon:yes gene_type:complete
MSDIAFAQKLGACTYQVQRNKNNSCWSLVKRYFEGEKENVSRTSIGSMSFISGSGAAVQGARHCGFFSMAHAIPELLSGSSRHNF